MKIGLFETLPILQEKLKAERIALPFGGKIILEDARKGKDYDLILSDKSYLPEPSPFRAQVYLVPGSAHIGTLPEEGILLTGGMNRADAVSFSSIGEEEAMLCLQQEICFHGQSIMPFEKKVRFDRNFSLYKNLAAGFALSLAHLLFVEDL